MALTALAVALILASLLWRSHGGLALACTMWILAFLYMRSLPSRLKTHTVAWFSVFLGLLCNAVVTIANGGIMPVAGLPTSFRPWLPSWCPEIPVHHLLVLADQRSLDYFSVGDVLIISGILLWGVGWLASFYKNLDAKPNLARGHCSSATSNGRLGSGAKAWIPLPNANDDIATHLIMNGDRDRGPEAGKRPIPRLLFGHDLCELPGRSQPRPRRSGDAAVLDDEILQISAEEQRQAFLRGLNEKAS